MPSHLYSKPRRGEKTILWWSSLHDGAHIPVIRHPQTESGCRWSQIISSWMTWLWVSAFLSQYMGQVSKVGRSCHPALLSIDCITRQQDQGRCTTMTQSDILRAAPMPTHNSSCPSVHQPYCSQWYCCLRYHNLSCGLYPLHSVVVGGILVSPCPSVHPSVDRSVSAL